MMACLTWKKCLIARKRYNYNIHVITNELQKREKITNTNKLLDKNDSLPDSQVTLSARKRIFSTSCIQSHNSRKGMYTCTSE